MATRFDTGESYYYPPPDERTLRNLFDERDPVVLSRLEYVETAERQRELLAGEVAIARTYDAAHVRAIHRHLFQDVFEWAGEYRTVELYKGARRGFAEVRTGEVERYLTDVHRLVASTAWERLDRADFGERAALVFAYLNQAHPFREGNGRTSKVFMEHVAERSRFTLDYALVTPAVWNQASMLSRPDMFAYEPVHDSLVPVFRTIAQERTGAAPAALDDAARTRSVLSASYPRTAQDAARRAPARGASGSSQTYRPGRGSQAGREGQER